MSRSMPHALSGLSLVALCATLSVFPPGAARADDPVTNEASDLLRESGIIRRQAEIGEALLLLDRQTEFARAIETLVRVIGPDVEIEIGPGDFIDVSGTPAGLRAQIEMLRLQRDLDEMMGVLHQDRQMSVSNLDLDVIQALIDERLSRVVAEREPAPARPQTTVPAPPAEQTERSEFPSARVLEVRGGISGFLAILDVSGERLSVMSGDILPGGVEVRRVSPEGVDLVLDGEARRLPLPR